MAKRKKAGDGEVQHDQDTTTEGAATTGDAGTNDVERAFQEREQQQPAPAERRQFAPRKDPFAIETINTPDNQLHLGKSNRQRAFMIRFNENPNAGREQGDPHPVLKLLKAEGYQFRAVADGGMAWVKPWSNGEYAIREEMDARDTARKAAVELGAQIEQGVGR